ncbi:MAG TPA: ATP-binding protein, partial [Dehalococcoidia bacterium]|nr:ATP-binding protein [Dehalococcoidia bacterium]
RGEQRVASALVRSRYVGPAPVPLEQYIELARSQSLRACPATAEQIYAALDPFVLQPVVRRALARAFHAGRPALIYGDTGNGKTSIVDAYARSFGQAVWIPGALYAHGHTIRVYDSAVHQRIEPAPEPAAAAAWEPRQPVDLLRTESGPPDRRWLRVSRPVVSVGGELIAQHLELSYDAEGGYYQAPPHLQAQDGILIIDDFGRQRLRPEDLLDRWIVPLERGYDLLSLDAGERLLVPFEACVLFSTNLSPTDLADEALLRRIPYKVHIPNPNGQEIAEIARRECTRRGVSVDAPAIDALVKALFRPGQPTPKGVFPRDLLAIIEDGARFDGEPLRLTPETIEDACQVYFVSEARRR